MITPNKAISFKGSISFKMMYILDEKFDEVLLVDLYKSTKKNFLGLDEFILALDALYVLGKIDVDFELGRISKC